MPSETTKKKYAAIRNEYQKWTNKKYQNVQKYTDAYIFIKLSEQFFLSTYTISDIVFYRVKE